MQKTNTNRILVIGGTGFIGSNLVGYLAEKGNEVVIYHRKDSNLKNMNGFPFKSVFGDLTDKDNIEDTLYQAMEGCKAVYNLAVCGSPIKKYHRLREIVNIEAAKTVAMVARKIGGLRLIHVSSSTAVGYPDNNEIAGKNYTFNAGYDHYALTKLQGEQAVLEEVKRGLDAVIAIPCSTVGSHGMKPHQLNVFKRIAQGKTWIYPPGGLCLTNVNDLVKGLVLCYEKGVKGERYILGGNNITYKQYLNEIAYATHGKAPRIRLPKLILNWLGFGAETFFNILKKETPIDKNVAKMIGKNLFYSSELSKKELGYTITDWRETIRETVKQLNIN
ncbi:MAG: NAD-dependent epimerase/dehydratase [Candidatus Scalindua rubra]|uniref:NAD-dependent epimerase/dehydratase n=1 Tax=Candidatus Scalindua rubra TaxID=1872076 RepID=A0A1E3XE62_9BACT|nr:MAG: NAD-dependent epimerase/dehydratase [Candidatus Scalindua rubra]